MNCTVNDFRGVNFQMILYSSLFIEECGKMSISLSQMQIGDVHETGHVTDAGNRLCWEDLDLHKYLSGGIWLVVRHIPLRCGVIYVKKIYSSSICKGLNAYCLRVPTLLRLSKVDNTKGKEHPKISFLIVIHWWSLVFQRKHFDYAERTRLSWQQFSDNYLIYTLEQSFRYCVVRYRLCSTFYPFLLADIYTGIHFSWNKCFLAYFRLFPGLFLFRGYF